jgi:lysophospholipid acyltransferase 7
LPFAANAVNPSKMTREKLKVFSTFFVLFVVTSSVFPLKYARTEEFYTQRSWLYRLFYAWLSFIVFRLYIYSATILGEWICMTAGLGGYPKELESLYGHGPTKKITAELIEKPENLDYDFETIQNMKPFEYETCLTLRESWKHWNRCIQFWMVMNVYKRFPSKKYRSFATMFVSAFWHGIKPGYYLSLLIPVFYFPIEDLYVELLDIKKPTKLQEKLINATKWTLKSFTIAYGGMAFVLQDFASS